MWEYLRNAWSGWLDFTDRGKLAAIFIALCAYLLLNSRLRGPQRRLAVYGGIAVFLCVFPLTAAVLMKYQTLFYDYPWIWSAVPFTAVIALGGTVFLTDRWRQGRGYRTFAYNTALTLLSVGALALCGGLGESGIDAVQERQNREYAATVLREVYAGDAEHGGEGDFCLWAPREILEYARSENSRIRLLYGRNMWDIALNAYSFDSYSEDKNELYEWMEQLTDYGVSVRAAEGQEYVQRAFSLGADCVLLPVEMQGWSPAETVWGENVEVQKLDRYYLLRMR